MRSRVGDPIRIKATSYPTRFQGRVGILEEDDLSSMPYLVRFDDHECAWFKEDEVEGAADAILKRLVVGGLVTPESADKATVVNVPTFEDNVTRAFADAQALLLERHAKYGPANISASPYGWKAGLITRLWDKLARLRNMEGDATDESRTDAWTDILNYGLIGLLNERGEWPS